MRVMERQSASECLSITEDWAAWHDISRETDEEAVRIGYVTM